MKSFTFYNPTRIYFGEGAIKNLKKELENYGKTVLLAYGRDSIKKNGIYDAVTEILRDCGKTVVEFRGIMPNPTAAKVREGIALAKENHVDLILAVGGGSTIDCSKAVAAGSMVDEDFWGKFFERRESVTAALPVAAVLTMVGTGSEMNGGGVVTNEEIKIKSAFSSEIVYPKFSILDPTYTYSLPRYQMVSGICDILSHLMEQYFSGNDDNVSDDLSEAMMKSIVKNTRLALINPQDYTARSNIMWGATVSLNEILGCAKKQDWEVHQIEHQLGAYYDVAHGMGLAAVSASYYRFIFRGGLHKFKSYAMNVWSVSPDGKTDEQIALEGIAALESFFKEIGAPISLRELGIPDDSKLHEIAESCNLIRTDYKPLTHPDVEAILRTSY
ncbi:MAG: iron-containing alcohol dehydrogenase [Oscillospiraceae bacterium]